MFRGITAVFCVWLCLAAQSSGQTMMSSQSAQLVVYLECPPNLQDRVLLRIDSLILSSPEGHSAIAVGPQTVSSEKLSGHQLLLVEAEMPVGRYSTIKLVFGDVSSYAGVAEVHPQLPKDGISIPVSIDARQGDATPLFLLWTPGQSAYKEGVYAPQISVLKSPDLPPGSLAYAVNEGSNNVTVIDRSTYRVVDVIAVARGPKDIAFSDLSQQLYVAGSQEDVVTVIDEPSRQIIKKLHLNFGDAPCRLALSPDGRYLYVLNAGSNTVSVVDIIAFQEIVRLNVGNGPVALAVDAFTGLLYVSSKFSSSIEVFDPTDFSQVASVSAGSQGGEISLNSTDKVLYVSHSTLRDISVVDLASGRVLSSVNLCGTVSGLAFNRYVQVLYAGIRSCNEVSLVAPDQGLETGTIALDAEPGRVSLDGQYKQLMVCLPSRDRIDFFSTNSRSRLASVSVGKNPSMIVLP